MIDKKIHKGDNKYTNANLAELISKVQMDCKAMSYSLRRIVCSDEDSHIILPPGRENLTDIVRDTNMFFKISVAGKTSRGRLILTYSPG